MEWLKHFPKEQIKILSIGDIKGSFSKVLMMYFSYISIACDITVIVNPT